MNGTQMVVRTARLEDAESVRQFLAGLSGVSVYRRFMSPLVHVSPSLLQHLVTVGAGQLVLLTWDGDTVVGHAMAVCMGEATVDLAIVVADEHQHTGIGHRLMDALIHAVAGAGVTRVHGDILSENRIMLDWLRRLVPGIHFQADGQTIEAEGPLVASAA